MDPQLLTESPFAALTFVAAPALLTNASSVLAMSTINRMLRTRDAMKELLVKSDTGGVRTEDAARMVVQVNRVERQAVVLLRALHAIYIALAAFAGSTLVTLLGAGWASSLSGSFWPLALAATGLVLGSVGVGGLVLGCGRLFQATRLSLINIRDEAEVLRRRHAADVPFVD